MYQKESPRITSSFSKVSIFREKKKQKHPSRPKKKQKHPIQTKKETKTPHPDQKRNKNTLSRQKNTDRNEDSEVINADEALN